MIQKKGRLYSYFENSIYLLLIQLMVLQCLYHLVLHSFLHLLHCNGMRYDTNANIFLEDNDLVEICKILGHFYCRLRMKQSIVLYCWFIIPSSQGSSTHEKRPDDYCFFCPVIFVTITNGELIQWTLLLLKISIQLKCFSEG